MQISDNFSYSRLIRFTIPSIFMMIVSSIYGVVDGLFVSNFLGTSAFSSLNIVFPYIIILASFGFMFSTGGCALVAKLQGEGKPKEANEVFTMLIVVIIAISIVFAVISCIFIKPISLWLGATPELLEDCITYGVCSFIALPGFMLQTSFQNFAIVANKPKLGMHLSLLSGMLNIVLDSVFIVVFQWGIAGAALATGVGQVVGGVIPLCYFLNKKNESTLRFVRFKWKMRALLMSCANGSSEMMTNVSVSLVSILYNLQLMAYLGANGVSAYGVIMYVAFIFQAVFIGYTIGVSPIVSYHYGANNNQELQSLVRKSLVLVVISSVALTLVAEVFASQFASIFVSYDPVLLELTTKALRLYSLSYLCVGVNIFMSALFTALNNGIISAGISFLRTLVLQTAFIFIMPSLFGIDGIWLAVVVAEGLCSVVAVVLLIKNNKRYEYFASSSNR